MQILLFARDGVGDHIREAVTRAVPETEVINTMGNLASKLRHPFVRPVVVILIAASSSDFVDIQQMKWLLQEFCTILILPDRNKETITAGRCFQPRFMGCMNDDGDEIAVALCKMLTREREVAPS